MTILLSCTESNQETATAQTPDIEPGTADGTDTSITTDTQSALPGDTSYSDTLLPLEDTQSDDSIGSDSDAIETIDVRSAPDVRAELDTGAVFDSGTLSDTNSTQDTTEATDTTDTTISLDTAGGTTADDTNEMGSTALCGLEGFNAVMLENAAQLESEVLISQLPDLSWVPSTIYKWNDLVDAIQVICTAGLGGFTLWTGDDTLTDEQRTKRALVNVAAFLAQSMKETIRYDACDENNWDDSNGYLLSNACGQLGQNYADYDCDMACPQDPTMKATAVTNAKWYGAPGPLFCAPDSELIAAGLSTNGSTGRWDYNSDCWPYPATEPEFATPTADAWLRPECEVYAGQKGGKYVFDGSGGSVEGCCWWGRGVIQTTGRCNFGILNHYLGATHLDPSDFPPPTDPPYPDLDFCKAPETICSSTVHPELKWIAGLFYWMASVQTYDDTDDGWSYVDQLDQFVASGLVGDAFIDSVSGIVNRGCHDAPCETGPVDGLEERRANFHKVLQGFGLK
jgi:hypothetical protein